MNIRVFVDGVVIVEREIELPTPSPLTASGVWSAIASEISAGVLMAALDAFTKPASEEATK